MHLPLSLHDVLHLEQCHKRVRLLVRTIDALHEPLACVDTTLSTELRKRMRVHPVPLVSDCCARSIRFRVGSLFTFAREVRLESTRNSEPFGIVREHDRRGPLG
jgi:hypothetical protein